MRLLAAGFLAVAFCIAVQAGEQLFELSDGRVIRGEKAGEDGDAVVIAIQAGGMAAKVRVAKSDIKLVRSATAEDQPTVAAAAKPVETPTAKAVGEAALEIKARDRVEAEDFARVRRLLAAAAQEAKSEYAPRGAYAEGYQSAMPGTDTWYSFPEGAYYPWYPMYGGGYGFGWFGSGHGHGHDHGHGHGKGKGPGGLVP
jgi:hypothetical protein